MNVVTERRYVIAKDRGSAELKAARGGEWYRTGPEAAERLDWIQFKGKGFKAWEVLVMVSAKAVEVIEPW